MKKANGRDGSPSRPHTGRAGSANPPSPNPPSYKNKDGALGESALPTSTLPTLPQRKRLIHTPPPWAQEGSTFFITANCIPQGQNQLATPEIATLIEESLRVRIEKGYWWPRLTLLMPDHIHTLMIFSPDQEIEKVIKDWKRYLARHAGIQWQRNFFDHRIRNETSLQEKWSYILQNPVRAGLVTAAEHWPYIWTNGIGRDDLGKAGSPSQSPLNIKDDIGRAGSPHIKNDLGRAGSANPPSPSQPPLSRPHNFTGGALGESALPKSALPNALPTLQSTTSKKP